MKFLRVLLSNSIFVLNALLAFLLIFRDELAIPPWLQVVGRMHPLLVHLPIGFILLAALMVIFQRGFKRKSFLNLLNFVLYFGALTAALAANMGLLLSKEGGYPTAQLDRHLLAGVAVSFLSWITLLTALYGAKKKIAFYIMLGATTLALLLAGHWGSVLTHGENFMWEPLSQKKNDLPPITDSTSLFEAAVHPILRHKCMSCHNERKAKGSLVMTTLETILKGGKHGAEWSPGDPQHSRLIQRILLPESDDDHMPPSGKPALTAMEINLLITWVRHGADVRTPWTKLATHDSLRILIGEVAKQKKHGVEHYIFPFADKETIFQLNTPYCVVTPIAQDEPALTADFFLPQAYDPKKLEGLLRVKEQLVALNLAGMPLTAADASILGQLTQLEKLNLTNATLPPDLLPSLRGLKVLKTLSLAGTSVDGKSLSTLGQLPSLREVFLWNTPVRAEEIEQATKQFPRTHWDIGYASLEILRLTPPLLVNEHALLAHDEAVQLKHNLNGTLIRYTTDGTDPDSVTGILYDKPIPIKGYTVITTRAFKKGWFGSQAVRFNVFSEGVRATHADLITSPDKDYKGEGAKSLTDEKKGSAENFRDLAWLGYRQQPLIASFSLDVPVTSVTVSYGENAAAYILPPAFIELWVSNAGSPARLVERVAPRQPKEKETPRVEGIVFKLATPASQIRVVVQPVARVPAWIATKPEKGWTFIDEIIFN